MGNLTFDFSGRTAVVTGPVPGIGNACGARDAHQAALADRGVGESL